MPRGDIDFVEVRQRPFGLLGLGTMAGCPIVAHDRTRHRARYLDRRHAEIGPEHGQDGAKALIRQLGHGCAEGVVDAWVVDHDAALAKVTTLLVGCGASLSSSRSIASGSSKADANGSSPARIARMCFSQ